MGLSQALFSAISGLTNHQRAMDNIGNNLANVNTVAFKKGVFQFRTLLEQTMRGGTAADTNTGRGPINPLSLGLGTQTGSINKQFVQGSLDVTGNQRDMAIEGNGYFVLRNINNYVFTRDGTFYLGSNGELLGGNGMQVQGVLAEKGEIPVAGDMTDIVIPIGKTGAAAETTKAAFTGNLNSNLEIATGIRLVSDKDTIDADTNLSKYLGTVYDAEYNSPTAVDNTWNVLTNGANRMINGGMVLTSAALGVDDGTGNIIPASLNTDLKDLYYQSGNSWIRPFANIDTAANKTITIKFRKGGRLMTTSFQYDPGTAASPKQSTTLAHLLRFLCGGVDDAANVASITAIESEVLRDRGGIMGTIKIPGKVSNTIPGGDSPYNVPIETAGAFTRTGVSYANSFNVSIVSNLGEENAITDLSFTYDNVTFNDIFANDGKYGNLQGGSATTNTVVYDSLGNAKNLTIQMTLVDRDSNFSTWRWISDSKSDTDAVWLTDSNGNITTSLNVGTGVIRFDSNGRFVSGVEISETNGINITLKNQGVNEKITIALRQGVSSSSDQDLNFSAMTQVAAPSDFNLKTQDGTAPGTLDNFTTTNDGIIQGVYSNGVVQAIARISIALIPNEAGMIPMGHNYFVTGPASGTAQIAFAGVGGRGSIRAGQLESSNVDLSEEFTRLITTERGFQANARVVSTADEMLLELVNLKR